MGSVGWSPEEAARLLAEVYAGSLGARSEFDPVKQEELARALDADPEYLEAAWEVWVLAGMRSSRWTQERIDEARYWLDAEFLGGLPVP
jgi:hypothetical protein